MQVIDAMGKACPIPVIQSKKVLESGVAGVLVRVDNAAAVRNLEKMALGLGYDFLCTENSSADFEVRIGNQTGANHPPPADGANYAKESAVKSPASSEESSLLKSEGAGGTAVMIGTNAMGKGAEELGAILIKGFIYSLSELPVPPKAVIFFNSGVYMTTEGANTVDDLKKLEAKGTKIMSCGTCVNYFELQDKAAVGSIVNMYDIAETIASAAKVINI